MKKTTSPLAKSYSHVSIQTALLPRLVEDWLLTCDINQCSERTIGNRRFLLGRLQWFLEDRKIHQCDTLALKQFFHYLNHGHKDPGGRWGNPRETEPTKPGTAETYYRHFRTFFNYLVQQGDLEESPLDPIQKPINRPDQVQPFTENQVKRILAAARHTTNTKRDTAIVYTLLDCALRASELLALRVGDVDLAACVLTVKSGKGGSQFTLMNTLGHTSLAMTSKYVKIADADTEKQHRQFSPIAHLKKGRR